MWYMAKKAIAYVEIEGYGEVTHFTHLQILQPISEHHTFSLQLPLEALEGENNYVFASSKKLIGKGIKIVLESDQMLDVQGPPFNGIILDVGFTRSFDRGNELILSGKSPTALLDNGPHFQSFEEKKLEEIGNDVLENIPENVLSYSFTPVYTKAIPYQVEYRESKFSFLRRIADHYGEWFFYDGETLIFGKPEWPEAISMVLGRDLFDFELKLSLLPINHEEKYYNYEKSETYTRATLDAKSTNYDKAYGEVTYNESSRLFSSPTFNYSGRAVQDQKELDGNTDVRMDQRSSEMVYLNGSSDNISLGVGKIISIAAPKGQGGESGLEEFGEFLIISVQHYVDGGGDYHNSFVAIPKEVGVPPVSTAVEMPSVDAEPAKVTDNDDPEGLGRIRVQFYWQAGKEKSPWIRYVSSSAGSSGGFFVIPEIGDEVMINYENAHPDKPFAIGAMYTKEGAPAGSWKDAENNIKSIRTKSGNEIILQDSGGTEEIKILNKGGENSIILTMSEGGAISIKTGNQINITGKNISVNAEEEFSVNAKNVKINTEEMIYLGAQTQLKTFSKAETNMDAEGDMTIKAQKYYVNGKTKAVLSSTEGDTFVLAKKAAGLISSDATVAVQGKGNVDVVSDANASISSKSMTSVGSEAGPVVVSGSVVQLN